MRRRHFAIGLAATAAFASGLGIAQQKTARIAVLVTSSTPTRQASRGNYTAFFQALAKGGWVEGRNLRVDWRDAEGDLERILIALLQQLYAEFPRPYRLGG